MAITINGTTGIAGVDGSASTPAVQGSDTNTGLSFASDTVNINTGGSTRATIDSSGNVGIGTSTINYPSGGGLTIYNATAPRLRLCNSSTGTGSGDGAEISIDNTTKDLYIENRESEDIIFYSGSERMRIHPNGNITIGHAQSSGNHHLGIALRQGGTSSFYTTGGNSLDVGRGTNDGKAIQFNRSGTNCGDISVTTSSTSYNTSSDYRLKENVVGISDGITRLKTLKPSRFNFKVDTDTTVDGFLAHEVTAVPEAISGTKDEVDSDNNPIYQGIDQSKLVPLLTAALQEAITKIETLETKVAALEAA